MREHRKLTFLLNVLLVGRTSLQPCRAEHFWANVSWDRNQPRSNGFSNFSSRS
jgi:hypothetical protein